MYKVLLRLKAIIKARKLRYNSDTETDSSIEELSEESSEQQCDSDCDENFFEQ